MGTATSDETPATGRMPLWMALGTRGRPGLFGVLCLGLGVAIGSSCAAHTQFAPPPRADAPLAVREHFAAQHTLEPAAREDLSMRTRVFEERPTVRRRAGTLGSGARVHFVEDLRPLVPAGSATAQHIDAAVASGGRADLLLGGGVGLGSLGLATALTLLVIDLGVTPDASARPTVELSPFFFGAAASFVVGIAGGGALATWGLFEREDAEDASALAFTAYNADLRAGLGVPGLR